MRRRGFLRHDEKTVRKAGTKAQRKQPLFILDGRKHGYQDDIFWGGERVLRTQNAQPTDQKKYDEGR
jgi:hypothetical protein